MKFNLKNLSRSKYLTGTIVFIFGVFIIRLFYIQIIQHDYYQEIANSEQIKRLVVPAERGRIFALDGQNPVKLVMNETIYTVFADPKIVDEADKIEETVKAVAKEKSKENIHDLLKLSDTRYQVIATKLTRSQADEIKNKKYKGVGFQASTRRVYPEGSLAAQVLGFVNFDGLGQYGIEGALNYRLKGTDGLLQSVTDVRDVPLTIGDQNIKIPKVNGDDLVLSIDRNIQAKAEAAALHSIEKTKAEHVNIVIIDPNNGQVKAMVNYPWYDPADINNVKDASLFNNATISNQYEPGSVMKSFTIVRGIDKGYITPNTTYLNTDYVTIDDRVISNATKGKTGIITMQDVYNMSLNTGTVEIMKIFGGGVINLESRSILYDFFHDSLGFGDYTGIELSGESAGTLIGPDTGDGDAVRYSNMSFGQGLDVTLIQTAAAYAAVVNGGTYYQPTILAGKIGKTGEFLRNSTVVKRKNIVSEASSRTLKNMAITGRQTKTKEDLPGYEVGGKTGTSQMIVNGSYSNAETTGSYLGFGGNEQAKYVIMITEYGKNQPLGGLHDCLPVFTEISNWLLGYLNIKPKG